ncbi:thioredoxin family protein [Liquorilactobacillus capillatus]|nr:thioredoxin family protein [Liquorilactobacillus capillatus]
MQNLEKMDVKELEVKLSKGTYVLFFTADWCPDCRFIKPVMPQLEEEYKDYTFIQVDRDENIDLCQSLGIMGIPSFVVYRDGKEIDRFVNKDRKTKEQVESFLNRID